MSTNTYSVQKRQPWNRPLNSTIPNRPGDLVSEPIFLALGKAVSAWEGVQAATSSLYFSMLTQDFDTDEDPQYQAFGGLKRAHERHNELMEKSKAFLLKFPEHHTGARNFRLRIKKVMASYLGWAERRNDIAHGYVTEARTPDYGDPEQPIITVYALCPSHARLSRWIHGQPEYNYVASELAEFSRQFQKLDDRIEGVARVAEKLTSER